MFGRGFHHPVGEAIAAETRQTHQVDILCIAPVALLWSRVIVRPVRRTLQAVSDGISSMKDRDFSVSIAAPEEPGLRALVASYNATHGGSLETVTTVAVASPA